MNLEELLKIKNSRVIVGERWLIYANQWVVYERKYEAHNNIIYYQGNNLKKAITILIS